MTRGNYNGVYILGVRVYVSVCVNMCQCCLVVDKQ